MTEKERGKNKDKKLICGMAVIIGLFCAYRIGCRDGERTLVEDLIDLDMSTDPVDYRNIEWPVYTSKRRDYGDLMFEVRAECIGD